VRSAKTTHFKYFKIEVEYTLHSHGKDGGVQGTNTEFSATASGNIHLK
jgi:hypothetical protein